MGGDFENRPLAPCYFLETFVRGDKFLMEGTKS